jgi:hypothetical protein
MIFNDSHPRRIMKVNEKDIDDREIIDSRFRSWMMINS